jgi:excisionase family DNA binding protein
MKRKAVYTTGEAAELCHLSQQTIIRCFDDGQLGGFRVPGSKFRRIPHEELVKFMQANDIPLDGFDDDIIRVLIVDEDPDVREILADILAADERFEVRKARTGYDAGLVTGQFRPVVLLLNISLPDVDAEAICRSLRDHDDLGRVRVIATARQADEKQVERLKRAGVETFIRKPLNPQSVLESILELIEK